MLTLEQLKAKSAKRMSTLAPVVAAATNKLIERCYNRGVNIIITQGLRTYAEQDDLYRQGRNHSPGEIVTNARGGYSNHNFGYAIDFALLLPDGRTCSWETLRDGDRDSLPDWSEVVEEGKRIGFSWGGDWRSFKDLPHLEMTFGISTAGFRAGLRPSKARIADAMERINRGDEVPMTSQEKAAFDALQNAVKLLTAAGQAQQKRIEELEARKIEKVSAPDPEIPVPSWAAGALKNAANKGAISDPRGTMDFYRMVVVMDKLGLFKSDT